MNVATSDIEIEVRSGTVEDVPLLLSFIRKMAEFEKLRITATEQILRDSLFGDNPAAQSLLAFADDEAVAYAIYFFTFASMAGKRGLWLDDLFVNPDFRGKGVGKALMTYLANIAIQNDCARFEWMVLDWNKTAINFYEGLGARVQSDWRICRLDENNLAAVAERLQVQG